MASNYVVPLDPWTKNPFKVCILCSCLPSPTSSDRLQHFNDKSVTKRKPRHIMDGPSFHPGLYSGTGYDLVTILVCRLPRPAVAPQLTEQACVASRPNPQVNIGAVDCSVALILCDLEQPDQPIVYASEALSELTGYSNAEVIGQNCHFLQHRIGGNPRLSPEQVRHERVATRRMKEAMHNRKEIQLNVLNYKKNGQPFKNCISIIPVQIDSSGHTYAVGFAVEVL